MDAHMMGGDHEGHGATFLHEEADVTQGIAVNLGVLPEEVRISKPATLQFFVNVKPEEIPVPAVDLEVQHEKRMHVIGVRRDLNEFFHIHPAPLPPDYATFSTTHTFKKPGEYKIWSEIKYKNENHAFGHPRVNVLGTGSAFELDKEVLQSVIVGNKYQVEIDYHEGLFARGENHVDFTVRTVTGDGVPLTNYLGEKMHLSAISEDLAQFTHTHPASEDGMMDEHSGSLIPRAFANGAGHEVPEDHVGFSVPFAKPGFYKIFAQFQPADANLSPDDALLAEFWVKVGEGKPQGYIGVGINPWWRNIVVSLALIAALGWAVKKYITVPLGAVKK